jgi:glutathione S-transferase
MSRPVVLAGVPGSPYTRKMRAVLRYRQIPHRFVFAHTPEVQKLPPTPRPLLPGMWLPEGEDGWRAMSDSTFQIEALEALQSERSVHPVDPAIALLDLLIEDYGDEWVTKQMFFYRWAFEENIDHACKILPLWNIGVPDAFVDQFRSTFGQRQIDRLSGVVTGDLEVCGPIIEASYERLLAILRDHLTSHRFVLGDRPGAGDFGLYGQLTQLVGVEPTSMALARAEAPRVMGWVDAVEDLSGLEVDGDAGWVDRETLGDALLPLLTEIGRTYVPFMLANASAVDAGAAETHCEIDGQKYWQKAFSYQRKCLGWLRDAHAALAPGDRDWLAGVLAGTGCEPLFR